jgi:hypothetical protein
MIRLDFDVACNMACTGLPEGWVIEIHSGKGSQLARAFPAPTVPGRTSVGQTARCLIRC